MDDAVAHPDPAFRDEQSVGFKDRTEQLQANSRAPLPLCCGEPFVV
jgi:hypothetical protein